LAIGFFCLAVYFGNQWRLRSKSKPKVRPNARTKKDDGLTQSLLEAGLGEGEEKEVKGPLRISTESMSRSFCATAEGDSWGLEAACLAVLAAMKNRYRYSGTTIAVLSRGKPTIVEVEPTENFMSFKDLCRAANAAIKTAAMAAGEEGEKPEVTFAWDRIGYVDGQWAFKVDGNSHILVHGTSLQEERSFKILFEACAADPGANVWELPMFTPSDSKCAINWGAPKTSFPNERDVAGKLRPIPILLQEKNVTPSAVALAGEGFSTTYQSLRMRANAVTAAVKANAPKTAGYEKSVILCMGRGEMIGPAFVGILQAGFTVVPVDVSWPGDRVRCVAQDAKAGIALVDAASQSIWNSLQIGNVEPILVGESLFGAHEFEKYVEETIDQDDTALILFTSGSTGRPKGILLSHGYLTSLITGVADSKEIRSESKTLLYHSPTWMPFLDYLLCPLLHGGCCLLYPETAGHSPKPPEVVSFANKHEATCFGCVPAVLDILLEHGLPKSMRQIGCGGALIPEDLCIRTVTQVKDCIMTVGYSGTEQGDVTQARMRSEYDVQDFANGKGGMTAGRPHTGQRIAILDRGQQILHTGGAIGEVTISGPGLASGYLAMPQQTAEYFVPCAAMGGARSARTGDLGRWDNAGNLEIVGRIGSMVKVRGARVDLGEVETAVRGHPNVTACAVTVHDDKLVAYAVPAVPGDLRDFCKNKLVSYMVPHIFIGLEELPKLSNGKINKKALKPPEPTEEGGETVMELDSLGQMRKFTRQNAAEDLVLDNVRAILIGVIIHGHNIPMTTGSPEMLSNGRSGTSNDLHAVWGPVQYTVLHLLVSGGWSSLAFLNGFDDTRAEHKGYGITYREGLFIFVWLLFDFNWTMWYFPVFVFMRVIFCAAHRVGLEKTHMFLLSQLWLTMPAFVDIYVGYTPYFSGDGPHNPPQEKICPAQCFCPFEAWPWFKDVTHYTMGYWNSGLAHSYLGHGLIFIPCYWIGFYGGKYAFRVLTKLASEQSWIKRIVVSLFILGIYYMCSTVLESVTYGYDDRCDSYWNDGALNLNQILKNVMYFALNLFMSLLYVVFIAAACPFHLKYLAKICFASLIFSPFFSCILDLAPMALEIRNVSPSIVSPLVEMFVVLAVPFTYEFVCGVVFTTLVAFVLPPTIKLYKSLMASPKE
jgi:acyl-CoA synthetase (AMP-forming)/AMP-acid ligase II